MPGVSQTLLEIAAGRSGDPLAPVTVIAPSHLAALQLRRRLAALGPFAAARFETLPRLAELLAAGDLAAQGKRPLARPIGDYLAAQVAQNARSELAGVRDLPGFGRVLRQMFRRIRRGGIATTAKLQPALANGYMGELLRLYGEFRAATDAFYDEEDLLDAASKAVLKAPARVSADLGVVYLLPPGALSAGGDAFARALRRVAPKFTVVQDDAAAVDEAFSLAPDPAAEAREVAREVLTRLESGLGIDEIAVFYSADRSYSRMLREAFDAAKVPAAIMPGVPLIETPAGRAVLLLASLPGQDYSRSAVMDFLALAPLKERIPGVDGSVHPLPATWDRLSREAGITKGPERWQGGLAATLADLQADLAAARDEEPRRRRFEREVGLAASLQTVIQALIARLETLRESMPARVFIDRFKTASAEYLRPDAQGYEQVMAEVDQLGTVDAVGGVFALESFVHALRANLEAATVREKGLGEGVLLADYRIAAGLRFRHAVLCGAYEGAFPAGPGGDTLVQDGDWARLRETYPFIEDAALRLQRSKQAAERAVRAAAGGSLTWSAPLYESGGSREYYPSPLMTEAARRYDSAIDGASALRSAPAGGRLRRSPSPLAAALRATPVDRGEAGLREAVAALQAGVAPEPGHRLSAPMLLLRSRRSRHFTEYEGNLAALAVGQRFRASRSASPTSLETYATCGFRYFGSQVLRLNIVEEPEEREVMEAAERGSLVHGVLDAFFKAKRAEGRPKPLEDWGPDDEARLLKLARVALEEAERRGKTGVDIFSAHDARTILADLRAFLEADNVFRAQTGAEPQDFEVQIPSTEISGVTMRGVVDRIDRSPDGRQAWVIDYKTGATDRFRVLESGAEGPFASGTKLQLPAYVTAAGAEEVRALYWFISRRGGFKQIEYAPTPENQERFAATVSAVLEGIGAGSFPAVPGQEDEYRASWANCRFCDFERLCSRRRDLDFAAKAADEAMRPWWQVGAVARGEQ